jgi:hypothetical protein
VSVKNRNIVGEIDNRLKSLLIMILIDYQSSNNFVSEIKLFGSSDFLVISFSNYLVDI